MLRPRPSVISLTRADVTDVVHRRRFRRYLECDEGNVCVDFAPVEIDTTFKLDRHATPPSRTAQRKTTPTTYDNTQNSSPIINGGAHHWVTDVPLLLLSDKETGEDVSPPHEVSASQVRRLRTRGKSQQGSEWTLQLCLRPKPGLPNATTPAKDDGSTDSQDSRENPAPFLEDSTDFRLKSDAGPSTPRRGLPPGSPGNPPTAPIASSRVSRRSFDTSDIRRDDRSSSEISSPSPTFMNRGRLRIYNDFLPVSSQPQTPQNLPRARRQNRLQGSYTAPARRISPQPDLATATIRPRRTRQRRREPSPLGLRTSRLPGSDADTENMDDAALLEGVAGDMARSWASPSRSSD
ncbi:predicted protein [Chaetomium globosum CBS 148.51]|uniref:Uncharacterized protein n=1 Tax=Chaetomium globosum (strain ATCC 6205 / CBS 148.51 / DSM 1962 / NBRC 6347 / NRRL 1970) TaxID=306901 RepID=Q2GUV6_CHAGB|nr:uncharacterized protein CHGG_08248 [Chaetomium globosum CBS 148.51]EAQ86995.1 predicted protein [Chaetomium globosum CBS 148.51]